MPNPDGLFCDLSLVRVGVKYRRNSKIPATEVKRENEIQKRINDDQIWTTISNESYHNVITFPTAK